MKFILALILSLSIQGCKSKSSKETNNSTFTEPVTDVSVNNNQNLQLHSIIVLEAIQVESYTYLRVKEGQTEFWMAAPAIDAKPGDTLYYQTGMLMTNFESKELKRTFDKILFVDKISKDQSAVVLKKEPLVIPSDNQTSDSKNNQPAPGMGSSKDSVRQNIKIEPAKNGIPIAAILKNPKLYEGKIVIIRGKITKYTAGVMGKNWVHVQDGTDYNGKFEIVITTSAVLKDGETATFEGLITLNKDLGYGYFFEILMEDAKIVK